LFTNSHYHRFSSAIRTVTNFWRRSNFYFCNDSSGNFIIVWEDNRNGGWDVYAQRYLSDGTPLDSNIKILDSLVVDFSGWQSISSDDAGNFILTWKDGYYGDYDIWAQRYLNDGSPVGCKFMVNTDGGGFNQSSPCVSADGNGDFIISWVDHRNGNMDVYAQRYLNTGEPLESNYRISNTSEMEQSVPAVVLNNNRIFTAWQDNREGQIGYDIWANVIDWDYWVGIEKNIATQVATLPRLHQNFPNPFSNSTTIKFDLPNAAKVKIEIFDYFGQKVETLLSKSMPEGSHQIEFVAGGLPPGVYFVRMYANSKAQSGGLVQMRKTMILQ